MAAENYYEILGLRKGANDEEVKQAFRELAKTLHPDRNPSDPDAERQFKLVSTAYEALKDELRRRAYDEWLAFARNHDRSRLAQWGRLAALLMLLLVGPSLALYWALVALDLAGPSRKDRAAEIAATNSRQASRPAAPAPTPPKPEETAKQAAPQGRAAPAGSETVLATPPAPPARSEAAPPRPAPPADEPIARERPRPTQRTDVSPSPAETTGGVASSAETPASGSPAAERRSLRELAGADDGQNSRDAPSRRTPVPPAENTSPPVEPDRPAASAPAPENSDGSGAARSLARLLAEFKEPNAAPQDRAPPERNQRQAAAPPEERPRPPATSERDGEDFSDCDRCPVMSVVVASDFAPRDTGDGLSARRAPVRTLAISRAEVTVAEWNACARDGACSGLRDGSGGSNRPVVDVSRSEAVAYAEWLSRKTGKFYRPMKSGGGWARSDAGQQQNRGERDRGGRGGYCGGSGTENDPDCIRQGFQPPRGRDYGRETARGGSDVSGFRVARSVGPND